MSSKENVDYYQEYHNTAKKGNKTNQSLNEEKISRKISPTEVLKEKPSLGSSTASLNKIQHLMDKLNEKIAIRVKL